MLLVRRAFMFKTGSSLTAPARNVRDGVEIACPGKGMAGAIKCTQLKNGLSERLQQPCELSGT